MLERVELLRQTMLLIDEANAADPSCEVHGGVRYPVALLHGKRMSEMVRRLGRATPPALLAARAAWLERWTVEREGFAGTAAGERAWREAVHERAAVAVEPLLVRIGWDDATIDRIAGLLRRRVGADDPDQRGLIDAGLLVFLQCRAAGLLREAGVEELRAWLRPSWRRLSPGGRRLARRLTLDEAIRRLCDELDGDSADDEPGFEPGDDLSRTPIDEPRTRR